MEIIAVYRTLDKQLVVERVNEARRDLLKEQSPPTELNINVPETGVLIIEVE